MIDEEMLALPMGANDADAETVGDYLRALLATVWSEEEDFSGKRPFGNSGWKSEPAYALVRAHVTGSLDKAGDVTDEGEADEIVAKLIDLAFRDPALSSNGTPPASSPATDLGELMLSLLLARYPRDEALAWIASVTEPLRPGDPRRAAQDRALTTLTNRLHKAVAGEPA